MLLNLRDEDADVVWVERVGGQRSAADELEPVRERGWRALERERDEANGRRLVRHLQRELARAAHEQRAQRLLVRLPRDAHAVHGHEAVAEPQARRRRRRVRFHLYTAHRTDTI